MPSVPLFTRGLLGEFNAANTEPVDLVPLRTPIDARRIYLPRTSASRGHLFMNNRR